MKKGLFCLIALNILMVFSVYAQVNAPIPEGTVQIVDDFEHGNYWIWAGSDWDRYDVHKVCWGCNLSKEHVSEGKYSMELLNEPVVKGSSSTFFYDGSQDLSGGKYLVVDVYNPGPYGVSVNMVFQATDDWKWLDTAYYWVPPKLPSTIVFDISRYTEYLNDVRRINFCMFFNDRYDEDSSFFIDNIRIIK